MDINKPTVGLQQEHGYVYGSPGDWVVRVNGIQVFKCCGSQYAQAKEAANAVFEGLFVAELSPRWSYHPELK